MPRAVMASLGWKVIATGLSTGTGWLALAGITWVLMVCGLGLLHRRRLCAVRALHRPADPESDDGVVPQAIQELRLKTNEQFTKELTVATVTVGLLVTACSAGWAYARERRRQDMEATSQRVVLLGECVQRIESDEEASVTGGALALRRLALADGDLRADAIAILAARVRSERAIYAADGTARALGPISASCQAALSAMRDLRAASPADSVRVDLGGTDLTRANLGSFELSGASFRGCILTETDFSHSNLHSADFTGCSAYMTGFYGADMSAATLAGGTFREARFAGASLTSAYLAGPGPVLAGLLGENRAIFRGAFLDETRGLDASQIDECCFDALTTFPPSLAEVARARRDAGQAACGMPELH